MTLVTPSQYFQLFVKNTNYFGQFRNDASDPQGPQYSYTSRIGELYEETRTIDNCIAGYLENIRETAPLWRGSRHIIIPGFFKDNQLNSHQTDIFNERVLTQAKISGWRTYHPETKDAIPHIKAFLLYEIGLDPSSDTSSFTQKEIEGIQNLFVWNKWNVYNKR